MVERERRRSWPLVSKSRRMDPEEAESREQQLLEDAFSYRTEKQYPEGATENRKKAAKCVVKDGVFFYKMKNKDKVCVCVHMAMYRLLLLHSVVM